MNCRILTTIVVVIVLGTHSHAQESAERVLPAESSAAADAAATKTSETGNVAADPAEAQVILIESSPEMERSEVILKIVKALEKEGIAKVVPMNEFNTRPVDFNARILVSPDLQSDSIRLEDLVRTLRLHGVQRVTFGSAKPDADNAVFVNCLPDVAWREVRDLQEALGNFKEFDVDVRVAQSDGPVTSTLTPSFTGEPKSPESHEELAPSDNLPPNDDVAQIMTSVRLKYVDADAMARIIRSLLNRTGRNPVGVVADEQINEIRIYGDRTRVNEAQSLVKRIDAPKSPWMPDGDYLGPPFAAKGAPESSNATDVTGEFLKQVVADFRHRVEDLDRQSRGLADQLKQPLKDPADAESLRVLLRDVVQKSFTTRQELRHAELELFAIRLRDLKQSVELRDRISDKIIDRRIEELLDPNLSWESSDDSSSSGDERPLWAKFGVTPTPVSDSTARLLEAIGLHLSPISNKRFRGKNVLTNYSGGLDLTFVETGGPAEKAGIHEVDILVALQGQGVVTLQEFDDVVQDALKHFKSDTSNSLRFDVLRNGETVSVNVPLPDGALALTREEPVSVDLKLAQQRLEICEASELSADEAATLAKSEHSREILYLDDGGGQVIPLRRKPETLLNETDVVSAVAESDPEIEGAYTINLELTPQAAQRFAEETRRLSQQTSPVRLAILLSGKIRSAPRLVSEILNGKMRITGKFTREEAEQLAADLIRDTDRPVLAPIPTRSNEN